MTTSGSDKVLKVIGLLVLVVLSPILYSFVQVCMWDWFVVPYFHMPHIGKAVMYGLNLLIATVFLNFPRKEEKDWYSGWISVLVLWGLAAVVHYWILP